MGKKANPAVIGGFVVGAVVLLVVGVLVFGSGRFWKSTVPWVMYFEGSIKGLQVGAPVTFRGVQIGQVTDIKVTLDVRDDTVRTPVYVEIDPSAITAVGVSQAEEQKLLVGKKRPLAAALIKRGLRAQLILKSLVTGQLGIQLDFHPDAPIRLADVDTDVPQFPTIESGMTKLTKGLEEVPIREIGDAALALLQNVDKLVSSPEVKAVLRSANKTLEVYGKVGRDLDSQVMPAAREALTNTSALMQNIDREVTPAARDAMKEAEATLATYKGLAAENSQVRYELVKLLSEGARAARSLRVLAEYLERHPEALLAGKGGPGNRR